MKNTKLAKIEGEEMAAFFRRVFYILLGVIAVVGLMSLLKLGLLFAHCMSQQIL